MKKLKIFTSTMITILILSVYLNATEAKASIAAVDRGEWTEWYGGNPTPQKMICASDWWTDECIVGDEKALPTVEKEIIAAP